MKEEEYERMKKELTESPFTDVHLDPVKLVNETIECKTCEKAKPLRFLVHEWSQEWTGQRPVFPEIEGVESIQFGEKPPTSMKPFYYLFCSAECLRIWVKLQADRIFQPR